MPKRPFVIEQILKMDLPPHVKQALFQQYMESQVNPGGLADFDPTVSFGDKEAVGTPPSDVDVLTLPEGTVVSGLPRFNQGLRNNISNLFTNFLNVASADLGLQGLLFPRSFTEPPGAAPRTGGGGDGRPSAQDTLNRLDKMRSGGGKGKGSAGTNEGSGPGGAPGGDPPVGASPLSAGIAAALAAPGALNGLLGLGQNLFGGDQPQQPQVANQQPTFQPTFSDNPNSLAAFTQLLQMFSPGGAIGASPVSAGIMDQIDQVGSAGAGQLSAVPGPSVNPSASPVPTAVPGPSVNPSAAPGPMAVPGPSVSPVAAPPGVAGAVAIDPENNPLLPRSGSTTDPTTGAVTNNMSDLVQQFSLPSFGGQIASSPTALQRQSTDFMSELMRSNPFADQSSFQQALTAMLDSGTPFDNTAQFDALEARNDRRLNDQRAQLAEQFGATGNRFSRDLGVADARLTGDFLAEESLQRANLQQSSFENAAGRRLAAMGIAPNAFAQTVGAGSQMANVGFQERQFEENAINRQMAEFARTQGAMFPLLLQFALAGTEGDNLVLDPV